MIAAAFIGEDLGKGRHVVEDRLLQNIALRIRNHLSATCRSSRSSIPCTGVLAIISPVAVNGVLLALLAIHLLQG